MLHEHTGKDIGWTWRNLIHLTRYHHFVTTFYSNDVRALAWTVMYAVLIVVRPWPANRESPPTRNMTQITNLRWKTRTVCPNTVFYRIFEATEISNILSPNLRTLTFTCNSRLKKVSYPSSDFWNSHSSSFCSYTSPRFVFPPSLPQCCHPVNKLLFFNNSYTD